MKKIDILKAFSEEPRPKDFVLPGLLSGTVGALISPGGVGKSFWALQAAIAVAAGKEADLLGISPQGTGRVVILVAEDPAIEIQHRLHSIGQHIDPDIRASVAENLDIYECRHIDITDNKHLDNIKRLIYGARLVFLDTIRRFHLMDENSTRDMTMLIDKLERLVEETNTTIVYLHHTNKASALSGDGDKQQAARGSSVLTDNVRWQAYVQRMSLTESLKLSDRIDRQPIEELRAFYIKFGVAKVNCSQPVPEKWYYRHRGGVLKPVTLYIAKKKKEDEGKITTSGDVCVPSVPVIDTTPPPLKRGRPAKVSLQKTRSI